MATVSRQALVSYQDHHMFWSDPQVLRNVHASLTRVGAMVSDKRVGLRHLHVVLDNETALLSLFQQARLAFSAC